MNNLLSPEKVTQILSLRSEGYSYRKIAKLVGCSLTPVVSYCNPKCHERRNSRRNARRKEDRKVNPERYALSSRTHSFKRKMSIITLLGGKCAKCGEDDWRVLQVNHVNGIPRGSSHRSGAPLYRDILAGKYPIADLELLCANCNVKYEYERGRLKEPVKPLKEVENDFFPMVS